MKKLAFLFVLCLFMPRAAEACGCGGEPNRTPEQIRAERFEEFRRADAVFSGQIIEADRFRVKLKVFKAWKGTIAAETEMLTGTKDLGNGLLQTSSCDYRFEKEKSYLVFASATSEGLITHQCSPTRSLNQSSEMIKFLDEVAPAIDFSNKPEAPSFVSSLRTFDVGYLSLLPF